MGQRLRINSSKTEYFIDSVEDTAKSFKICSYNFQNTKKELLKFKDEDPVTLIRREKVQRGKPIKGVKAFYITKYDPRLPHPRQLISSNYHHLEGHPILSHLFPRENLVGGTRRLKNLSEFLSPTVQSGGGNNGDNPGGDDNAGGGDAPGRWNGSYHCQLYKSKGRCDVCTHMVETSTVTSPFYNRRFAIHGRNIHLPASQGNKLSWFVYVCQDTSCNLIYVGSTVDVCRRWSQTKKACLDRNNSNTGLYKHFRDGCPTHATTGNLNHLTWTLVDRIDTTEGRLVSAGHQGGPKCRCSECMRLKSTEDKWICRLGAFHGPNGLNSRDEIKARSRVNFVGN